MTKFIALFKRPENVEEFDKHYNEVHTPLITKTPGMEKITVTRISGSPMGESPYYLIAEMYFKDAAAFKAASASAEWRAAGKDLMAFAGPLVTMMIGEE
jgi:uncharacterized protein (TIGR02118 family)